MVPFYIPRSEGTELAIKLTTYEKQPPPQLLAQGERLIEILIKHDETEPDDDSFLPFDDDLPF